MTETEITYKLIDMDLLNFCDAIQSEYWGKALSTDKLLRAFETSFCVSVKVDGKQVGFARAVSDTVTCSYIRDLVILKNYRGQGFGRRLMKGLLAHPDLNDVQSWFLGTKSAHAFYEGFGFQKSPDGIYMFLHCK